MENISNTKFPISYSQEAHITAPKNVEVLHDTNNKLILAFPGGDRMAISITPGSKIFSQSTENNIGSTQSVNASTIRGPINADTVKSINANQITGKITASQIESLNANQITGQLTASQIDTINASSITGSITSSQIGSVAANTITVGKLESNQINSINVGTMTVYGSLSTDHTDAKCTDATADNTQSSLDAGASIDNAKAYGHTLISGGYINTNILTADNIQTGTLTGIIVQTAADNNQRAVLYSSYIQFDSASNTNVAQMYGDNSGFIINTNLTGSYIYLNGKAGVSFEEDGVVTGLIDSSGLNIENHKITNLAEPSASSDAATKNYVDSNSSTFGCSDLSSCSLSNLYPGLYVSSTAPSGVTNRLWVDTS